MRIVTFIIFLVVAISTHATEVVYRIVEYNKSTAEFTLAASGMVPKNSWVYFENEFGATTGNRYNQIPRNKKATLYLEGWRGCTVKKITLSMCSNNKSGQVGLSLLDGERLIYTQQSSDFASEEWFGQWVSKDLNVYVDITKHLDIPVFTSDEGSIILQGGSSEGSVYLDAITIEYEEATGTELESPLGWGYEKLNKKSVLNEGDEVMIYRNGYAATDIDGMETSHYLDVTPLATTTDVTSHDVLRFTLNKADNQGLWRLTTQYGKQLSATGKQALAWDAKANLWNISLGYDGATITNVDYGSTIRYNAPTESYARFNVYTSTSLPLPFLYRKAKQKEPELSHSLTFPANEITANLAEKYIVLKPTLLPTSTTDKRICWTSNNESVATVNGGYVTLLNTGETTITAKAQDGKAEASIHINVIDESTSLSEITTKTKKQDDAHNIKVFDGHHITIHTTNKKYDVKGILYNH